MPSRPTVPASGSHFWNGGDAHRQMVVIEKPIFFFLTHTNSNKSDQIQTSFMARPGIGFSRASGPALQLSVAPLTPRGPDSVNLQALLDRDVQGPIYLEMEGEEDNSRKEGSM